MKNLVLLAVFTMASMLSNSMYACSEHFGRPAGQDVMWVFNSFLELVLNEELDFRIRNRLVDWTYCCHSQF